MDEGVRVLGDDEPAPSPEFRARLRHRLLHVRDEGVPGAPGSRASGFPLAVVLALGALAVLVAWSPVLRPAEPTVRLPALVVEAPPDAVPGLRVPPSSFFPSAASSDPGPARTVSTGDLMWGGSATLFLESSPLPGRVRPAGPPGVGRSAGSHRP